MQHQNDSRGKVQARHLHHPKLRQATEEPERKRKKLHNLHLAAML